MPSLESRNAAATQGFAVGLAVAVGLVVAVGCGDGPRMAPVKGAVLVDGKPLGQAGVTFTPVEGGRPAWATTDANGRFELTTLRSGDGAFVGEHVVTVAEPETDAPVLPRNADPDTASLYAELPTKPSRKQPKGALDPRFASRSTSGLTFTVEANKTNVAEFDLTN